MIYDYKCSSCDSIQEESCSVNSFKEFKPQCNKCGSQCDYTFSPTNFHIVLKDGPSGSWPSKGIRVKEQRRKASEAASIRQKERYKNPSLIPNFNGNETESWREAKEIATKEIGSEAASTYDDKVNSEIKI